MLNAEIVTIDTEIVRVRRGVARWKGEVVGLKTPLRV